jgi:hypothetical protein
MNQWVSATSKQQWIKLVFSIFASLFSWWYIHETLMITKVFNDIPLYIDGLPITKTLGGLRKDNRLSRQFSLTLKGRKCALNKLKPDQLEVRMNAANRGDVWKDELTVKELRCLNPLINLERDVIGIEHTPLSIRLSNKVIKDIPITISSFGTLPKGYKLINILPNRLMQTVEGPDEAVYSLANRRLFLNFDLGRVSIQQIEKNLQSLPSGSETYYKIPDSWKCIDLPPPIGQTANLKDSEAHNLTMVLYKFQQLKVEEPIPIRISPLPITSSSHQNYNISLVAARDRVALINHNYFWIRPVYVEGVSHEFLSAVLPHLELVIYLGAKGNNQAQFEIANIKSAQQRYVKNILKTHFEYANNSESSIQNHLNDQFWNYFTEMTFQGESKTRIDWDISFTGKELHIKESE